MKISLSVLIALIIFAGCASPPVARPVKPVYGTTNPSEPLKAAAAVKRFASVIELIPQKEIRLF